jgi:hypothetical protein
VTKWGLAPLFPSKLTKLVNFVCADDRIAVATKGTERMQAIFERLSFWFRAEVDVDSPSSEMVATKVAGRVKRVEFFIVASVSLMS